MADAERGSVLMLFPAGVLVLLVLAAISFDFSLMYQRKRALVDQAATAASDAATYGISEQRLRADGAVCLDPERARRSVLANLAVVAPEVDVRAVWVEPAPGRADCATTVVVTVHTSVARPFGRAVPGTSATEELEATARASVVHR